VRENPGVAPTGRLKRRNPKPSAWSDRLCFVSECIGNEPPAIPVASREKNSHRKERNTFKIWEISVKKTSWEEGLLSKRGRSKSGLLLWGISQPAKPLGEIYTNSN